MSIIENFKKDNETYLQKFENYQKFKYRLRRSDLINYLIKNLNYKTYLEVGVNGGTTYTNIDIETKECIDPKFVPNNLGFKESDLTYKLLSRNAFIKIKKLKKKYDIIFIDGLHEKNNVYQDILDSLEVLNKGGLIVTHDSCPPAQSNSDLAKSGDVYKSLINLKIEHDDIDFCTVNTDLGCGIIKKNDKDKKEFLKYNNSEINNFISTNKDAFINNVIEFSWKFFKKYKKELINLIEIDEVNDWIDTRFGIKSIDIMEFATGKINGVLHS